jgi:mono/diheme cytochrome c family protein
MSQRLRRLSLGITALAVVVAGALFWLTTPQRLDAAALVDEASSDPTRGETVFWAGGCASCHATPKAEGEAKLILGGGEPLQTPFGTFHAPNISPDRANGLGDWTYPDFANAMQRGVGRDGSPLYPAFPYPSYIRMTQQDVADLWAFLKTLPAVAEAAPPNDLAFPFNLRRGVALWQRAFLDPAPVVTLAADASDAVKRGQYLVEGPGHCGECHTPRQLGGAGGLDTARSLGGAANPAGKGSVPNITPGGSTADWSESDLASYFETGFTPDYDSVGGAMVAVQENLAKLPAADREAIAAYLKAVPAVTSPGT